MKTACVHHRLCCCCWMNGECSGQSEEKKKKNQTVFWSEILSHMWNILQQQQQQQQAWGTRYKRRKENRFALRFTPQGNTCGTFAANLPLCYPLQPLSFLLNSLISDNCDTESQFLKSICVDSKRSSTCCNPNQRKRVRRPWMRHSSQSEHLSPRLWTLSPSQNTGGGKKTFMRWPCVVL